MRHILITGANRGLGLELTRQTLNEGERLFATCRRPEEAHDLHSMADEHPDRLSILPLDVMDEASIASAKEMVRTQTDHLDLLINNAGVNPPGERLGDLEAETLLHTFHVNAVGPMMVTQQFLDLLRAGERSKIVNISSQMGSLIQKKSGGSYSYCTSKAALNMLTRALAFDLRSEGIIVVAMHPGWVRTDMGGSHAPLSPAKSVSGMLRVIDRLRPADTGRFLTWRGRKHPW